MLNVDGISYAALHTEANAVDQVVPKFGVIVSPNGFDWYRFLEWGPLDHQARTLPKDDAAAVTPIVNRLAKEREAARSRLLEGMDSDRYVALLDRLVDAATEPRFAAPGGGRDPARQAATDILPGLVQRPWRRLAKAVQALPETPADEERLRVGAELFYR